METNEVMQQARAANHPDLWDRLWASEGPDAWRSAALAQVYRRVEQLVPMHARVADVGGGVGDLAVRLKEQRGASVMLIDASPQAVETARARGLHAIVTDVETHGYDSPAFDLYVATEVFEHLSFAAQERLLAYGRNGDGVILSIPNNRLGPDEEPQHTCKLTAKQFLDRLHKHFGDDCRVEVLGPYLLGVAGKIARKAKDAQLSVCFPARDEAADIEATLASFRGVADELVVGVDPRSTDRTRQIAEEYADVVFDLDELRGPLGDEVEAPDGFHFAHARNQCLRRCTMPWIFMSEAHERLIAGRDVLLHLDKVMPRGAKVAMVFRTGGTPGAMQRWAFPWLVANDSQIRYERAVHNTVVYPESYLVVGMPQVGTLHDRAADRAAARTAQRKVQNRTHLMEDWVVNGSAASLWYLGQEWRGLDDERAAEALEKYLRAEKSHGQARYQARLVLAKLHAKKGRNHEARDILLGCTADDWTRTEHWLWLGDLAFEAEQFEEARRFYSFAAATINEPPFTVWWIDLQAYSLLPAQRMAQACAALGRLEEALRYAELVKTLLPEDAPASMIDEADGIIGQLNEVLRGTAE